MAAHNGSGRNGNGATTGTAAVGLQLASAELGGVPGVSPAPPGMLVDIEGLTERLLHAIGEDPTREGLAKTPERVARAWEFLTSGYHAEPADVVGDAIFPAEGSQLVVVREIEFFSLCEHHLLPFFGKVHVGYLPDRSILGLSKIARLVEVFARRLQVQERLTAQVAHALASALDPHGVAVVVEAEHLCMTMRGVQKPGAITMTSCMLGAFEDDPVLRGELQDALGRER